MNPAVLRLLQLTSPALPVGGYSYSEGLEYAVHAGWVRDADGLRTWLIDGLTHGATQLDAAIVARVYDAQRRGDHAGAVYWDDWLTASRETEELRQQSQDMGRALMKLLVKLPPPLADAEVWLGRCCHFATAFAIAGAHWHIERHAILVGYLQSVINNVLTAGIKLIPLGQTAGQQLLWGLQQELLAAADRASRVSDDGLGVTNCGFSLASMAHEAQYSRLFRS